MSEAYEAVLNHLLFHKALLPDDDGGERIDRYLAMVREIERGQHIALRDPLEKSIAAAFELVFEAHMDPWAIDLAQFTRMYLDKVHQEGTVNFVTAGRLVFMAWSILKMQSDHLLEAAAPAEAPAAEEPGDLDFYREPEDVDFNQAVLAYGRLPLHEAIRREGRRAVTLIELVDAFDEARREAEAQLRLNALREAMQSRVPANLREKVHGEDISEDIGLTWGRIAQFNGQPIPLRALMSGNAWDTATVFMAVLFLAKMEKIRLWQKDLPAGEIFVKRLAAEASIAREELATIAPTGPRPQAAAAPGAAA